MKIASSTVAMQSEHYAAVRTQETESLRAWVGQQRPDFEGNQARTTQPPVVQISDAGMAAASAPADKAAALTVDAATNDPRLQLLIAVLEWMTGKRIRVVDAGQFQTDAAAAAAPRAAASTEAQAAQAQRRAGFGIEYSYHAVREEVEQTRFALQGSVTTADGREIAFNLDVGMARSYREQIDLSFRAGDVARKDPLVINFGAAAAQLSSQRMKFDLDNDGKAEQVALLGPGSGYLALDLNHDGTINSGAELFGAATGAAFAELAKYDEDGNGWIDEGDSIFRQLRIWIPAADGEGSLSSLAQYDVGALFLGHQATPFELRGERNQNLGAVRDSGVYLTESGVAGSLQQIDLTV